MRSPVPRTSPKRVRSTAFQSPLITHEQSGRVPSNQSTPLNTVSSRSQPPQNRLAMPSPRADDPRQNSSEYTTHVRYLRGKVMPSPIYPSRFQNTPFIARPSVISASHSHPYKPDRHRTLNQSPPTAALRPALVPTIDSYRKTTGDNAYLTQVVRPIINFCESMSQQCVYCRLNREPSWNTHCYDACPYRLGVTLHDVCFAQFKTTCKYPVGYCFKCGFPNNKVSLLFHL